MSTVNKKLEKVDGMAKQTGSLTELIRSIYELGGRVAGPVCVWREGSVAVGRNEASGRPGPGRLGGQASPGTKRGQVGSWSGHLPGMQAPSPAGTPCSEEAPPRSAQGLGGGRSLELGCAPRRPALTGDPALKGQHPQPRVALRALTHPSEP